MLRKSLKRSLSSAREAFENRDVEASKQAHKKKNSGSVLSKASLVTSLEQHSNVGQYVKSMVFGGLDGLVSAFAVVSTGYGADYSYKDILGIGLASMIVEGLSMGLGDYFGSKAEEDYTLKERERELWEVNNNLEGERSEMIELYTQNGMKSEDAQYVTDILARYKEPWVDVMLIEELGIVPDDSSALMNGVVTFCSFILFRTMPFIPYIIAVISKESEDKAEAFYIVSVCLTATFLFVLGVVKSLFSAMSWYISGLQSLVIGVISAGIGLGIGYLFEEKVVPP